MSRALVLLLMISVWGGMLVAPPAVANAAAGQTDSVRKAVVLAQQRSLTDRSIEWPQWSQLQRVILLQDYNTRVVILGTLLLGLASGLVGSFTLLRRRALMGDALSHATLPGIGLAFMIGTAWGGAGKSLTVLLIGAAVSGLLGVAAILFIRNQTRLKEDTALGIVLSVFFGAGVAVLGVVQQMESGHAAGLEAFIYGKTASMVAHDAYLIAGAGGLCLVVSTLVFKELKLLCFDEAFAGAQGLPRVRLDMTLMGLVVLVTIIGLQAVGLILMIALLVIPAAAARFWTERMERMAWISAGLGGVSGTLGAGMSAVFPKLPSGAMIVLVSTGLFAASMVFGLRRGLIVRWWRRWNLQRRIDHQHLLRGIYEILESRHLVQGVREAQHAAVSFDELQAHRSWSPSRLRREVRRARRQQWVEEPAPRQLRLTGQGLREAARLTHQHRLWEMYLISYADVAPSRVDRDADAIEHILEPGLVARLESLLEQHWLTQGVPQSPHDLQAQMLGPGDTREGG